MDDKNILEQPVIEEDIVVEDIKEKNEQTEEMVSDNETTEETIEEIEETEETEEETEEAIDENEYLSEDFVYSEDLSDLDALYGDDVSSKKGFSFDKSIIIAACIFLCAIIGVGGYMLFTKFLGNNFYDTWVLSSYASIDEATDDHKGNGVTYITLNDDGSVVLTFGTMKLMGQWSYNSEDETKVDIVSYSLNGTFDITVEGNIFVGKKMTISNEYGSLEFTNTSIPDMYVEKTETSVDKDIVGEWSNNDYKYTYTFYNDGSCHINTNDELLIDGVYSTEKGVLTISYISDEVIDTPLNYELSDGKLVIEDVVYEKVK